VGPAWPAPARAAALLTVLAAKRAAANTGYPWALAGLFSAASVAFNIAHAPDRPVAQLVFAMAPVALVLTTQLLMQQASWRRPAAPELEQQAGPDPAQAERAVRTRTAQPERGRTCGRPDPGVGGLPGAASCRRPPTRAGHPNGDRPAEGRQSDHSAEGR
jgi:hypothetical protein